MLIAIIGAALAADPWLGAWEGKLEVGASSLRVGFTIEDAAGGYVATMQSPDQGAMAIPVDRVDISGDQIALQVAAVRGQYAGKRQGDRIVGTWSQGMALPLTLSRVDEVAETKRPQTPEPPFPYTVEEVTFASEADGVTLVGTLTLPQGAGASHAVVLVSGSGPQDRDETLFGHKPFAVLADHLTRQGIAVLRYDDRGVGASTGTFAGSTSRDFAKDAAGAVAMLEGRADIDEVGLLGHSEGAWVAAMVAGDHPEVDFVVLLGAHAVPGDALLAHQGRKLEAAMGVSGSELERLDRERRERIEAAVQGNDALRATAARQYDSWPRARQEAVGTRQEWIDRSVRELGNPWMQLFLRTDPDKDYAGVSVPVLALYGARDLQVDPAQNAGPLKRALASADVRTLEGLNHLFQPAERGTVDEYATIETTIAPRVLEIIAAWIDKR